MLKELHPGLYAWTTEDHKRFRSFAVVDGGEVVLIDPVAVDAEEANHLKQLGQITAILLTSAWHERDAEGFACQFKAPIYAHPDALPDLEHEDDKHKPEALPDALPLGLVAWEVPGALPGQVAYYWPRDGGSLIVGDCWMNLPLEQAPWYMRLFYQHVAKLRAGLHLLPPAKARDSQAMIAAYRRHLEQPVERLLVSHGSPIMAGARERMLKRLDQGP